MAAALIGRSSTAQKCSGTRKSKAEVFNATAPIKFSVCKQDVDEFRVNDHNSLQGQDSVHDTLNV